MKDEDFPLTLFTQILCLKIYKKLIDSKALIFGFNFGGGGEVEPNFCDLYMDFPFKSKECLRETDTLSIYQDL